MAFFRCLRAASSLSSQAKHAAIFAEPNASSALAAPFLLGALRHMSSKFFVGEFKTHTSLAPAAPLQGFQRFTEWRAPFLYTLQGVALFSTERPPCETKGGELPADVSPDSDEDFQPQYRKVEQASPIHKLIEEDVKSHPVMVYMKGVPSAPMCGFSSGVVQLLKAYGVQFHSRNVLEDPDLRQGIKTYSQWPTIPQVFVNGEFVGGCDILFKMHESGELESLFESIKDDKKKWAPCVI